MLHHARPVQLARRFRAPRAADEGMRRMGGDLAGNAGFSRGVFTRIVPAIKDIGLWGPKVTKAYADMGVMAFADINLEEMGERDQAVAEEFDAQRVRRDDGAAVK